MNLENYETVKKRKKRFYSDNPDGRIIVKLLDTDYMEFVIFHATCYKNKEDQEKNSPWSTGHALEIREKELSVSREGNKYASVNFTSWLENCEESAVGRCLDNAGYSGNDKCSREEMKKVDSINKNISDPANDYVDSFSNQAENIPSFDDIGKDDVAEFKVGDPVPKKYWDDKKNSVFNNLWTEKRDDGKWYFKAKL